MVDRLFTGFTSRGAANELVHCTRTLRIKAFFFSDLEIISMGEDNDGLKLNLNLQSDQEKSIRVNMERK